MDVRLVQGRWSDVVRAAMRDAYPVLALALGDCRVVGLDAATITVAAPANRAGVLEDPGHGHALARAFDAVLGAPYTLVVRREAPGAPGANPRAAKFQPAMDDPVVRDLIKRFAGDVIEREPLTREGFRERLARDRDEAARPGGRRV
jgi:hypothetical protein